MRNKAINSICKEIQRKFYKICIQNTFSRQNMKQQHLVSHKDSTHIVVPQQQTSCIKVSERNSSWSFRMSRYNKTDRLRHYFQNWFQAPYTPGWLPPWTCRLRVLCRRYQPIDSRPCTCIYLSSSPIFPGPRSWHTHIWVLHREDIDYPPDRRMLYVLQLPSRLGCRKCQM